MEWRDEKEALLETIRRQEQESSALARRFQLLQQTLQEQQKLLDRYQRALGAAAKPKTQEPTSVSIDKASSSCATKNHVEDTGIDKQSRKNHVEDTGLVKVANSTWMKKKTADFSDLTTTTEVSVPLKKEKKVTQEKKSETAVFKPNAKRRSGVLAATWAEEKKRMLKKSKWEDALTASGANKENVDRSKQQKSKTGFAYVEVVRNREERKALPAHDCMECKKYYDALGGLGAVDAAAQKNKCSRHRARFEPYQTPDDFWRLSFPDSEPEPRSPSVI